MIFRKVCNCYICKKQYNKGDEAIVIMKAVSSRFVTYSNCEEPFSDRAKVAICNDCIREIAKAVNSNRSEDRKSKN
jgi:hypothetical protein